jgi:GTP-binding protein
MANVIAIVGRPNVGKSTLFNRLIEGRKSIVHDTSGVTRDRQYGMCFWNGKEFNVIDTGGFIPDDKGVIESAIREQVMLAITEAIAIIFVLDVMTGITDLDEEMANILRRTKKPVYLAVNKVDNIARSYEANEFWSLGFENTYFISSINGSGTGDLLDAVVEHVSDEEEEQSNLPKFSIIGRPNVGKSSLVNALLGEERNIVTDISGTTRDTTHSIYNKFGKELLLIDTAGIRKKAKVHENLEFYSVLRAIRAIEEADVCFLMIDANVGFHAQDMSIFSLAQDRNKGIVLLINKWDLIEKSTNTAKELEASIRKSLAPFNDIPILFISVLDNQRVLKALDAGLEVFENRQRKIKTSQLNEVLLPIISKTQPPMHRGKTIKIKYITQLPMAYPAFAFFCNYPKHVKPSYKQFLINQIRKNYNFTGVPIKIFFRQK